MLSPGRQLLSADLSLARRVCERAGRSVERSQRLPALVMLIIAQRSVWR